MRSKGRETSPQASERLAVVVVTYNSALLLPDLLDSLGAGLAGLEWQLVIVDNASHDGTLGVARRLAPQATLVDHGRNGGYAAGINAGVRAAEPHDAILVLNPDVRLCPGSVATLVEALRAPGVGIAVPRLEDGEGRLIESLRREPTVGRAFADTFVGAERAGRIRELGEVVTDWTRYERQQLADWAEGSTQLISANCWSACGPWDESFFLYSEETDFNLRARDAGFATLYVPSARAVHLEGGSGVSPALTALLLVNRVRLFRRRNGALLTVLFWLAVVLREASRVGVGHRDHRAALHALLSPNRLRAAPGPDWLTDVAAGSRS